MRRELAAVLSVLALTAVLLADDGLPSLSRQWFIVDDYGEFQGTERYPDYIFYLFPTSNKIEPGSGPLRLPPGATVLAVPKNHPDGANHYSPEWFHDPKVLRSQTLSEGPRKMPADTRPTVRTIYRVEITDGKLKCEQVDQQITYAEQEGDRKSVV